MAIISDNIRPDVERFLSDMQQPVTADFYPHATSPASDPMKQLLLELKDINPLLQVVDHGQAATPIQPERPDDIEGPVTSFSVNGAFTGVRYLGFPGGQEFTTFLEDIVDISRNRTVELSQATQDWLKSLTQPLHLEVFVTPT
ncbi:MAG: hypothetical protein OWU33_11475 [Firmicutes bacterium]|jgi:alkyl hydroperoxide reductase subunit AhpF|nr:hypothetical protein [Bacillota bacterium]